MPNTYELRGYELQERQLFLRTYTMDRKKRTAMYFIERGEVFCLAEDGSARPCNFSIQFLNVPPTTNIEPLNEFYQEKTVTSKEEYPDE